MTCRRIARLLGLVLVSLLLPAVASAQLSTGDVYGVVADENGAPLPGATLTLTGVGGPKTTTSDEQGRFRFIGLYPGDYSLRADLEGFSGVEQTGLGVRIGGKVEVQLTMNQALGGTLCAILIGNHIEFDIGGGCRLYNDAIFAYILMGTTGAGPGTGSASLPVVIPGSPSFIGMIVDAQWGVLDPLSPSPYGASATPGGKVLLLP